jgi:predicted methyltransferase
VSEHDPRESPAPAHEPPASSRAADAPGPLLTLREHETLTRARDAARRDDRPQEARCSLDLDLSTTTVLAEAETWSWHGVRYPYLDRCRDRTVYYWTGGAFEPVQRYTNALIKLVPTDWGPPTFEIDGIKMLPTAKVSPYDDARAKVDLVQPRGRRVLDTCGGLGYFAAWCLRGGAARIDSWEKNPDVLWLRQLNPWSPDGPWWREPRDALHLRQGDVSTAITTLPNASYDAILHDPPRFGIAGELYSAGFYAELARVLVRGGRLFHYTGTPNRLTSGRDVPGEVLKRLRDAGFAAERHGDGVLATRRR